MSGQPAHPTTPPTQRLAESDVGIEHVYSISSVEVISGSCYIKSIDANRNNIYNKLLILLLIHDLS